MFKKLILHSGKFSMTNIWFNLRCLGKIKYRSMLGFLTHTLDNSFKTAPDFFLVLRKFVPKSSGSLSCELWAVAAASAGLWCWALEELCCLQELEGLSPETEVVWAAVQRGRDHAQQSRGTIESTFVPTLPVYGGGEKDICFVGAEVQANIHLSVLWEGVKRTFTFVFRSSLPWCRMKFFEAHRKTLLLKFSGASVKDITYPDTFNLLRDMRW